MARAKRTARAEARRRYRATATGEPAPELDEDDAEESTGPGSGAPASPPARRSLLASLSPARASATMRDDLRAFPQTVRRQRSFWAALGLVLVGFVAGLVDVLVANPTDTQLRSFLEFLVQFLLGTPQSPLPALPVLIAGFFAVRGGWLVGMLVGLVGSTGLLTVIYAGAARTGTDLSASTGIWIEYVFFSAVFGAVFGALASWYRGFLRNMTARNAAARAAREKQQRRDSKRPSRGARPAR